MTPYELKWHVLNANPDSKFFTRVNMRFLGDTLKNYGVRGAVILSETNSDGVYTPGTINKILVFELYRKRAVKHGVKTSVYFHAITFKTVYKKESLI